MGRKISDASLTHHLVSFRFFRTFPHLRRRHARDYLRLQVTLGRCAIKFFVSVPCQAKHHQKKTKTEAHLMAGFLQAAVFTRQKDGLWEEGLYGPDLTRWFLFQLTQLRRKCHGMSWASPSRNSTGRNKHACRARPACTCDLNHLGKQH